MTYVEKRRGIWAFEHLVAAFPLADTSDADGVGIHNGVSFVFFISVFVVTIFVSSLRGVVVDGRGIGKVLHTCPTCDLDSGLESCQNLAMHYFKNLDILQGVPRG